MRSRHSKQNHELSEYLPTLNTHFCQRMNRFQCSLILTSSDKLQSRYSCLHQWTYSQNENWCRHSLLHKPRYEFWHDLQQGRSKQNLLCILLWLKCHLLSKYSDTNSINELGCEIINQTVLQWIGLAWCTLASFFHIARIYYRHIGWGYPFARFFAIAAIWPNESISS